MKRFLGVCCVLALMTSVAFAQDQARPQRGGAGFGGGFGRAPGGFGGGTSILAISEVQQELKLTDDQKKQVRDVAEKTRQELGASFQGLRDLSEEERNKKIDELRKKREESEKATSAQIAKILDEKQNERFAQLCLQRDGVAALGQSEVAKKLGLNQEQKDKIAKLQDNSRQASGGLRNFQNLSDEERRAAFDKAREAREKLNTDLVAVLTADQKTSWDKMLGAKFDFPQGGFGGRPGGAPGARPGTAPGAGRPGGATPPARRSETKKDN